MFGGDVQEPATTRLLKEVSTVCSKLLYVLGKSCYAHKGEELIKWDIFGPFIVSMIFPLTVYFPRSGGDVDSRNLAFSLFFSFLWFMSLLTALNGCLLGINL
ncbi:uncharacterized protein BXIN_2093 [Babesia sp. Xinjiang]|uniref:uncharacterized protein n=1 Tax=Babesia sp. Xinjiang TaxID=462227 RepID=UPI000A224CE5|nr:uncharacterized protein BXIN_2093 [Babesia sp. Xinjiang]ORM40377.1 hypothetical protein BXIN_2093 [Babesia sp. Xinjiang]